jgi:addiction module HigA family antidote
MGGSMCEGGPSLERQFVGWVERFAKPIVRCATCTGAWCRTPSMLLDAPMAQNEFAPVTPGEMLKEEFLAAYGLSQNRLAKAIGISPGRIAEIVNNRRRITADTALRLGLYFGNSPEFWMNLQAHYDLKMARRNLKPADAERIKASRAA